LEGGGALKGNSAIIHSLQYILLIFFHLRYCINVWCTQKRPGCSTINSLTFLELCQLLEVTLECPLN